MKKGTIVTGIITERRFPDKGVLLLEEGPCIVKNTLPGQEVEARIIKTRKGKMEARLLRVLRPAPTETVSPCPVYGDCGGCSSLTLPYGEECRIKEQQVRALLAGALESIDECSNECSDKCSDKCGDMSGDTCSDMSDDSDPRSAYASLDWFEGLLPSPVVSGYRNKMEFSFGNSELGGPLTLGMHRRGSFYDIVDAGGCVITDGDFRTIVRAAVDFFRGTGLPFYHRMKKEGYLRHLLVRKAAHTGEILVDLVTTSRVIPPSQEQTKGADMSRAETVFADTVLSEILHDYTDLLASLPLEGRLVGILHTVNDSPADVVRDDGTEILWGTGSITEDLLGLKFEITPFSFFQTNSLGAELLYSTVRDYLTDAEARHGTVYDLYSGTGTIAQLMAPVSRSVIGVEIVEEAVQAAVRNAAANGINNCSFVCGDVLKVLDDLTERPDLIILDPPRDGIHPKALPKILSYGVPQILYISCKPTSLARDLPAFVAAGYRPVRGTCVDMFPRTANVETVCLLSNTDAQ